jgi:hypothetical protein
VKVEYNDAQDARAIQVQGMMQYPVD